MAKHLHTPIGPNLAAVPSRTAINRRICVLWLPRLSAEIALRHETISPPFAITVTAKNAVRIACPDHQAEAQGVVKGQSLADARAVCPDLTTRALCQITEKRAWAMLRRWAQRYSPLVARTPPERLTLDITGCAHLFGGEEAMLGDVLTRLRDAGFTAHGSIADTKGAAWAMGLAQSDSVVIPNGQTRATLLPVPLAGLRLSETSYAAMRRLGLKTIGDLVRLPRSAIARRFGLESVRRLDEALGAMPEPIDYTPEPPRFSTQMTCPDPLHLQQDVLDGVERLLTRLCATLERHGHGARQMRLALRRTDGSVVDIPIELAAMSRDPARIRALFEAPVSRIDAGFGIDHLHLTATRTEALCPKQTVAHSPRQEAMSRGTSVSEEKLSDLLNTMVNRLGPDRVRRPVPCESHQPERAFSMVPVAQTAGLVMWPRIQPTTPQRPVELIPALPIDPVSEPFSARSDQGKLCSAPAEPMPEPARSAGQSAPPQHFRWQGVLHKTLRAHGPERVTPAWWLDDASWRTGLRDYWRVETDRGERLWVFSTPQTAAIAVASAGGEREIPRWYIAGRFA
ncbi:MAG: DNA polymerase Y family protein [Pseudomonadota bacterium]